MTTDKKVRFGVIGPGGAGRSRTAQLASSPSIEVVAAADTSKESVALLERTLGQKVEAFIGPAGYRRMIDSIPLDAVGIFSPHTLHYDHAMYALEHNLHILIEKPMICGVGPATRTAKLARKKNLVCLIHYQRHYQPVYIKGKEMIKKGMIGEVKSFYVYMAQDWWGWSWRGQPKYSGGGQINDSGSHYQDILLWMTGLLPRSVEGYIDCYYHGRKRSVPINGTFTVELSNGAEGRLIIVGDYIRDFSDDVRILGSEGTLVFSGNTILLYKNNSRTPRVIKPSLPKGYPVSPADNFARLLTGRCRKNYVDAIFGARVALLTEALLLAGKTGKRVYCSALLKKAGYSWKDLRDGYSV